MVSGATTTTTPTTKAATRCCRYRREENARRSIRWESDRDGGERVRDGVAERNTGYGLKPRDVFPPLPRRGERRWSCPCRFRVWDRGGKEGLYRVLRSWRERERVKRERGRMCKRKRDRERNVGGRNSPSGNPRGLAGGSGSVAGRAHVNKRPSAVMAASATSDAFRWLFSPGCLDVA